ncbi:hypothetical protein N824_07110 [Pedobacter sp. V48]|nr:hypothetical protein N824_07110 [Pedobacter sp. V48]
MWFRFVKLKVIIYMLKPFTSSTQIVKSLFHAILFLFTFFYVNSYNQNSRL